jgi:hypothetical protein
VSLASASVGPFATNADKWTRAIGAAGPDMVLSRGFVVEFEIQGALTVNQTPWSYVDTTAGWYFELTTGGTLTLNFRNGGVTTSLTLHNDVTGGVHVLAFSRKADGTFRYSWDGGIVRSLSIAAYTSPGAGGVEEMGGVNTALIAGGRPCIQTRLLNTTYITAALTDAELVAFAGIQADTDRYTLPSAVTSHANLVTAWQATDWDGASGTTTAGFGSTPATYTKNGTIVKNTLEAENIYRVLQMMCSNGMQRVLQTEQDTTGGGEGDGTTTYVLRNPIDSIKVDCANPSRVGILVMNDTYENRAEEVMVGMETDGVPFGGGRTFTQVGRYVGDFATRLPASISTLNFISGIAIELNEGTDLQRGIVIEALRVPASTPITKIYKPHAPARRLVLNGDSITVGMGTQAQPPYQGYGVCMRKEYFSNGGVTVYGWGGRQWWEQIRTPTMIDDLVARLKPMFDGTTENVLLNMLDRNDYNFANWNPTDMATAEAAFYAAMKVAIPGLTILAVSNPVSLGPNGANALGFTLQQYRDGTQSSVTGLPYVTFIDGTTLMTTGGLCSDNTHPDADGYETINEHLKQTIGYANYYWQNFNTVPYSWVGDSGYVNNTGAVATWSPYTGAVNFVQATGAAKPAQADTYGSLLKGKITFDGAAQWMSANALAAAVSGSNKPFSFAISIIATSITPAHNGQYYSWSHSTTAAFGFHNFTFTTTSKMNSARIGDAGVSISVNTVSNYGATNGQCIVGLYDGSLLTIRRNAVATSISGTNFNKSPMTVDQHSIGVFTGGGAAATTFFGGAIRAILSAPGSLWNSDTYKYIETKLINEAVPA